MLEVIVLATGSTGNCIVVRDHEGAIVIDAGIRPTKIVAALEDNGIDLDSIHAITASHEHSDHVQGMKRLAKACPHAVVLLTPLTADALEKKNKLPLNWIALPTLKEVYVGGRMTCTAFPVSHDAADPVGYRLQTHSGESVAIATDMGTFDDNIVTHMRNADILCIETNHDPDMLKVADRPESLKDRIRGVKGHLSNQQAYQLAVRAIGPRTKTLLGVHISMGCNMPDLAHGALQGAAFERDMPDINVKIVTDAVEREIVGDDTDRDSRQTDTQGEA